MPQAIWEDTNLFDIIDSPNAASEAYAYIIECLSVYPWLYLQPAVFSTDEVHIGGELKHKDDNRGCFLLYGSLYEEKYNTERFVRQTYPGLMELPDCPLITKVKVLHEAIEYITKIVDSFKSDWSLPGE